MTPSIFQSIASVPKDERTSTPVPNMNTSLVTLFPLKLHSNAEPAAVSVALLA